MSSDSSSQCRPAPPGNPETGRGLAAQRYHIPVDQQLGEDLGHGVYASPAPDAGLTVTSPRLDLPWRAAEGQVPGTAVLWRGRSFEVTGAVAVGSGTRWTLRPWDDPAAMRNVFELSREAVQTIAERAHTEVRNRRARAWTLVILPLLGLAPAILQKRWANEWGFAASRATLVSSILEMLVGAVGTVQIAAAAFGAQTFMPIALALPGPLLFVFGAARLAMVFGDGEPVGSPLGAPLLMLVPKHSLRIEPPTPAVRSFEDAEGELELVSPILRQDWDRDGCLQYRGFRFRLDRVEQEGRFWVYFFSRADDDWHGERALKLVPPPAGGPFSAGPTEAPPSFLRTMLITAAVTLGPASDQQRWATELGIAAVWLTVLGGAAELVGGFANLQEDFGSVHSWLTVLDFFLVGEGLLRLGSAVTGRPMGSLFGWALRPLYRPYLPPTR